MKIQSLLLILSSVTLFALPHIARADYDHWPVRYACETPAGEDGVQVRVDVTDYEPVTGTVIVSRPEPGPPHFHAITRAGHEAGDSGGVYFAFDTPQGEATLFIAVASAALDGSLVSPYGSASLTCRQI